MQSLKSWIVVLLCASFNTISYAFQQVPYLERLVTLNANDQKISEIFKAISKQTDVIFSYTGFNDGKKITKNYHRVPLKKVLDDLLKDFSGSYVLKGKYIIVHFDLKNDVSVIAGYVFNAIDSNRIENVDIYMKQNQYMTVSDQVGFFSVQYTGDLPQISLLFKKDGYEETTLLVSGKNKGEVFMYMNPTSIISVLKRKNTDSLFVNNQSGLSKPTLALRKIELPANLIIREPVKQLTEEEQPASPKMHHEIKLGLHAAIAIPIGGSLNQSNMQLGLEADYFITNNVAIGLNGSINSFTLNNEPDYEYFKCSVTEFSVSGGYYLGKEKWRPHIGFSVGLYKNKVDYSYTYNKLPYPYAYYVIPTTVTNSETENKFGYAPQAGLLYELTKRIDFDLTMKYHVIASSFGTIPYWGVTAGFLFNL